MEWGEIDAGGIIFYPNYFRWFDAATHELFRAMGIPLEALRREGILTPILSAGAEFKSPLRYDDEIVIRSEVAEVRRTSFRVEHTVTRNDEVVGQGHEWRIWVTEREGQLAPEPVPDEVRARMSSAGARV